MTKMPALALASLLALLSIPAFADPPRCPRAARQPGPVQRSGRQHLAVIAIDRDLEWTRLANPVRDAREIRDLIVERCYVDEVHELHDDQATKANILRLLVSLQQQVGPEDSLLILYCGHGHLDEGSGFGFWIPANAGTDPYEQQNRLPLTQLRGLPANMQAMHLFVISDSCLAGDLLNATRSMRLAADADYFRVACGRTSRQVLTSVATELVPEVSDFAARLKTVLGRHATRQRDALMLYHAVPLGAESTIPLLGTLAGTGHQEGGSFLLFLKEGLERTVAPTGVLAVHSERRGVVYVDGVR